MKTFFLSNPKNKKATCPAIELLLHKCKNGRKIVPTFEKNAWKIEKNANFFPYKTGKKNTSPGNEFLLHKYSGKEIGYILKLIHYYILILKKIYTGI